MDKMTTQKIRKLICVEMEEIADKPELSTGDLNTLHVLTDTYKNTLKIDMMDEDEYSQAGYGRSGGRYSRDDEMIYERGSSYRGRDSMGRYSREDEQEAMKRKMERMARDRQLPEQYREAARAAISEMR